MVVASPPTAAGFIEVRLAGGERLLGVVSGPEQVRELTAEPAAILRRGLGGPEASSWFDPGGGGGAGVSELVDAEGERVIGADARCDHLSPVVIELIVESGGGRLAATLRPSRISRRRPCLAAGRYPGSNLVSSVLGVRGLLPVNRELVLRDRGVPGGPVGSSRRECPSSSSWLALYAATASMLASQASAWAQLLDGCGQGLAGVGGPAGEHPLVFGYLVGAVAGRGSRGRFGRPGWDRVGGPAPGRPLRPGHAGRPGSLRGRRRRVAWCSRCGWAGGSGTGRCIPGRRPGRRCPAGGRPPRCRLGLRRRSGPTNATGSGSRPCGCPARSWPATPPPRRVGRHARSSPVSSTRVTVAVVPLTSRLPEGPQRACSSTRSPAW